MEHLTVKQKTEKSFEELKDRFGYKNKMSAPRLKKVVVSVGTGTYMKRDRHKNDEIKERLAKITGQRPRTTGAKKSVASFKIRQGDPIGVMVTLRGARMYAFLEKFINIALPRTRDFRGIRTTTVDSIGNLTIGIKEHTIFPETADEDVKDLFGLSVTLVSTAKSKEEGFAFYEMLGIPFKKEVKKKK